MSLRPPHGAERHRLDSGVVDPQPREELAMKRVRVWMMGLVVVFSLWAVPAGAQDTFTLGIGKGAT
jgi:hypothetical protein